MAGDDLPDRDDGNAPASLRMTDNQQVPTRFPEDRTLDDDLGSWWVLHIKPNCEKKVASYLLNRKIGYYLPLYRKKTRVGYFKRYKTTEVPLFRGYLCIALPKKDHNLLYGSKKVVRIIEVEDQERFVKELQAVAKAVETGDDLSLQPGLVPGQKVVILSGPLEGTEGTVVNRRDGKQLALSVQMFNQSILVKLDASTELDVVT
jgi:transcription antitermination factor NusG